MIPRHRSVKFIQITGLRLQVPCQSSDGGLFLCGLVITCGSRFSLGLRMLHALLGYVHDVGVDWIGSVGNPDGGDGCEVLKLALFERRVDAD